MNGMNRVLLAGTVMGVEEKRRGTLDVLKITLSGEQDVFTEDGPCIVPWFHDCEVLGESARAAARRVTRGVAVMVDGALAYHRWPVEQGFAEALRVKALQVTPLEAGDALGLNEVTISGHLGRRVVTRESGSGPVAHARLCVNERYRDRAGAAQEATHWVDVVGWRHVTPSLRDLNRGAPIIVRGRLVNESWTDDAGRRRTAKKVEALRVWRGQVARALQEVA